MDRLDTLLCCKKAFVTFSVSHIDTHYVAFVTATDGQQNRIIDGRFVSLTLDELLSRLEIEMNAKNLL